MRTLLPPRAKMLTVVIAGVLFVSAFHRGEHTRITDPPTPFGPVPSAFQLAWQEDELTLFVHFGMNTFTGLRTGSGTEDPSVFNPTDLDCTQWVNVARETGFKGIILTAKHHDGFCLWPTKTTTHSVRSSSWEGGKGDVVRELADACKQGGLRLGIYCSPWDRSQAQYDSDRPAYSTLYREQLRELLTNYGPVYEMWFDGNRANIADWQEVISLVRSCQPGAVIKQGPRLAIVREDVRWVGNEMACAPLTCWSVYPPPGDTTANARIWFPVECDIPMIGSWFWDGKGPKELAQLLDIYYTSVGRNSILLLNVAPDKRGRFSDESVQRLHGFHDALQKIFSTNFAKGAHVSANNVRGGSSGFGPEQAIDNNRDTYWATDDTVLSGRVELDLGRECVFNVLRLEEMISLGQRVQEYRVDYWDSGVQGWRQLTYGTTIGYRKLDRFPAVRSSKIRLTIVNALACPTIREIGVHFDGISSAQSFEPDNAFREIPPKHRN